MLARVSQAPDPRAARREQILDIALKIADRDGFDGLTMRKLSAELGVSAPIVYRHFEDKAAIIDATNLALTRGDCTTALINIEPLYSSNQTDNQVRMLRASANGCFLGIEFFGLLASIASEPLAAAGFWTTTAKLFYSDDLNLLDKRVTAGGAAADALMSVIAPGTIVPLPQRVDNDGNGLNVGSVIASDRTVDANLYLIMTSMATISALQNRYSETDPTTFVQGQVLGFTAARPAGWALPTNYVTEEGCEFAASVLNFVDAVDEITANSASGGAAQALAAMNTGLKAQLHDACESGCQANAVGTMAIPGALLFPTGCAFPAGSCSGSATHPCPDALRDRSRCSPVATDVETCAAAGIATFINDDAGNTHFGWAD